LILLESGGGALAFPTRTIGLMVLGPKFFDRSGSDSLERFFSAKSYILTKDIDRFVYKIKYYFVDIHESAELK
jgi:hypothetical protein